MRAARISRTAKTVSIALLVFLLGSFVYIGGFIMDLLALNWLGVIPLHTGIATAAHLILRYVDLSLQAPSLAPPLCVTESSSHAAPRVSR